MKIFTKTFLFCAETMKENVQLLLNIFFMFSKCVTAPRCILMIFKERATASERYQCAETVKENVQLLLNIFVYVEDCVAASRNASMIFNKRADAYKRYQ